MTAQNPTHIKLLAADGYPLAATHYPAHSKQFIVMASATDYRGIGDSKPATLKGFDMQYADWSTLDLAAAVNYALERGKVWLVGHSLGGHAIGQLPDANQLQAAYVCGTGAGWHGWMPRPERYRAWAMWNLIGPVATQLVDYLPMSKLSGGEDLPMGVYRDWKRWCALPHYFFDDPEAKAITEKFADVRIPIGVAVSTDDLWAPPASRDAFFKGYRSAPVDAIDLHPSDLGVKQVGHMGYFRPQTGQVLWPKILGWLGQHGLVQNKI